MKVLLIGGGGREHAIALSLKKSARVTELLCAPGNAGIASVARVFPDIRATDLDGIVALAKGEQVDFVVVAPDDPLALGLVDRLESAGIPAFGPTAAAARIEASKVYSKALMKKYGIPTAAFEAFDDLAAAEAYIRKQGAPIVVKCDGLALGKGVVVAQTIEEALEAARSMMRDKRFGDSGARVVVEACLSGPEVTQLVFTDGEHVQMMPSSRDHKRAYDEDKGPNTGGMGAIAPAPAFGEEQRAQAIERIVQPTIAMLSKEGTPFKGVLYFGLMLTKDGPMVIEYNARFGDPETQAVLPLLQSDLMDIFIACREGGLDKLTLTWSRDWCASVVLASGGYPAKYETGYPIAGIEEAEAADAIVFHAGTRADADGRIVTAGGRVLAVSALGESLDDALDKAYRAAGMIAFQEKHMRTDLGRTVAP
jgi:phosphoribosylamine--glycine ligase